MDLCRPKAQAVAPQLQTTSTHTLSYICTATFAVRICVGLILQDATAVAHREGNGSMRVPVSRFTNIAPVSTGRFCERTLCIKERILSSACNTTGKREALKRARILPGWYGYPTDSCVDFEGTCAPAFGDCWCCEDVGLHLGSGFPLMIFRGSQF